MSNISFPYRKKQIAAVKSYVVNPKPVPMLQYDQENNMPDFTCGALKKTKKYACKGVLIERDI